MNERIITTESMKADHQTWLAAHAQWREDIERWQAEHKSAVARLAEMQKTVQGTWRVSRGTCEGIPEDRGSHRVPRARDH